MSWYWWAVIVIGSVWFMSAILQAIGKNLPARPASAGAAMMASRGDFASAEKILVAALKGTPPSSECEGKVAEERFELLLLRADITRKWTADAATELELLNECASLVARPSFPLSAQLSRPYHANQIYMMHMNRAIAAGKMALHSLAEESLLSAFQAAHEPETKCKCLAYLVWDILRQEDSSKLDEAQSAVEQFDTLVNQKVPPALVANIETGRAILRLFRNDVEGARAACVKASRIDPNNRVCHELTLIVLRPNASAADAEDFLRKCNAQDRVRRVDASQRLSPLPEGIVENPVRFDLAHASNASHISDREFEEFEATASGLSTSGQDAKLEALAKKILRRHTQPDIRRVFLLYGLSRALMRQDKLDEALETSSEAICLAHQCNSAGELALMLDNQAEILCFARDLLPALRTLAVAEHYLREGQVYNSYVEGLIAHTRGMAYNQCGWLEAAEENLRKAIQLAEHFREWDGWALAVGDFVSLVLRQAFVEGSNPDLLKEALDLLGRAHQRFELANNESKALQAKVDALRIESMLGTFRKDAAMLWRVQYGFGEIINKYGGPHGFFNQPGNFPSLLAWTVGVSSHSRTMVDIGLVSHAQASADLEAQLRMLERAAYRGPRLAVLWQEKARLHLCRGRHDFEAPTAALLAAANCMENAMDILRSLTVSYDDPQVRAGWLANCNDILENLAEIATYALTDVWPQDVDMASRMVSMAQYLRARSRQDLLRSPASIRETSHHNEITDMLARIRNLNRWLEKLDENGQKRREDPSRDLGAVGSRGVHPTLVDEVRSEILRHYPEYGLLVERGHIEDKLEDCKREFSKRVSANALVRLQATQSDNESPFELSALQEKLGEDEVVLDYYVGPSALHVAVVSHQDLHVMRLPVDNMREFHNVIQQHLFPGEFLALGMRCCSAWLFPKVLVDLLTKLPVKRLYVVASGPLWRVPFPWLDARGQLVLERWETCITPSARLAGTDHAVHTPLRSFAIGHPGKPFLKNVEEDVKEVSALMNCPVLFKSEATPERVLLDVLPEADLVHFACHGGCDPVSPLMSCLLLEPDSRHPDGRLTLHEILGTPLRATVINLGACHTARSEGPTIFPESLAHALLGAGARFVIGSLWAANDKECRGLTHAFYTALGQGIDPAVAFHKAQLQQAANLRSTAGYDDYGSIGSKDFALVANFVILSAKSDAQGRVNDI